MSDFDKAFQAANDTLKIKQACHIVRRISLLEAAAARTYWVGALKQIAFKKGRQWALEVKALATEYAEEENNTGS